MLRKNTIQLNCVRCIVAICMLGVGLGTDVLTHTASAQEPSAEQTADLSADSAVIGALGFIGTPYRWGGDTPATGFDCSGFVQYVFENTRGVELPRRAIQMSRVGQRVAISQLRPGDLVFFHTIRRAVSHVGIYIGNNEFIHSPSTGHTIRIDHLTSSYWKKRLMSARRFSGTTYLSRSMARQDIVSVKRTTQFELPPGNPDSREALSHFNQALR